MSLISLLPTLMKLASATKKTRKHKDASLVTESVTGIMEEQKQQDNHRGCFINVICSLCNKVRICDRHIQTNTIYTSLQQIQHNSYWLVEISRWFANETLNLNDTNAVTVS